MGDLVPSVGWQWAQCHHISVKGESDRPYTAADLEAELWANNWPLAKVTFCVTPHWQSVRGVYHKARSTIVFAFHDPQGSLTEALVESGVYMFSERTMFIPIGNRAATLQCTRCWAVGHATTNCHLSKKDFQCSRCGGKHHDLLHDVLCTGFHAN